MQGFFLKLILFLFVFSSLIYFNYSKAQKALQNTKNSVVTIKFINFPTTAPVGSLVNFSWRIEAPNEFQTSYTTIFYGPVSTPSALTKQDSPEAVGYPNKVMDYIGSSFFLPDTFNLNLTFPHPGKIWYRGYAKVREDHLWTEEKYLNLTP